MLQAWDLQVLVSIEIIVTSDMEWYHFNTYKAGNACVLNQHCGYWCPGAKAPGHAISIHNNPNPKYGRRTLDTFLHILGYRNKI